MGVNPRNLPLVPRPPLYVYGLQMGALVGVFYFCYWMESAVRNREVKFRDNTALFRGINPDPVNKPSWGKPESQFKFKFSEWNK